MARVKFDASQVTPGTGFDPIPPGRYNFIITDSDYVANNAGTGHYLKLTCKVLEGEFVNRLVWINLNLDNPNSKAVEIAQRELSAICHACDVLQIEDSQELHGIPFSAQVTIRKGTGQYEGRDSNDLRNFKAIAEDENAEPGEAAPWA